jgi:hypothetical protein
MADMANTGSRPVPDPTELTTAALLREILALRELLESRIGAEARLCRERFEGLDRELVLIERQRVEQKQDSATAIAAALGAAKEAVGKSEMATTKSIDQLAQKVDAAIEGLRRESGDLKARVGAVEQQKVGRQETTGSVSAAVGYVIGAAGVLAAVVALVATL